MTSTPEEAQVEFTADITGDFYTVARAFADDSVAKVNGGAALVYAIYHHPRALKLMTGEIGDVFWSGGLRTAYSQACAAYGIGNHPRDEDFEPVLPQPDPQEES